jgi:2-polyprenyl-3-methyl-5-hydroxy-6-metoxy-1,4-benzoquinol methylase
VQRLADNPEILDGPSPNEALLRRSLGDLRRVNRWLGGGALSRIALVRLATRTGSGPDVHRQDWGTRTLRVLDVGTGLADIPAALLGWAGSRGIGLEIEAIDARPETIAAARGVYGAVRGLELRVADGRSLPYPDASFDVAHTSLMAHHLEPAELRDCLAELRRVSRLGVIVNDLDRNVLALAGAWLLSRLFTRSHITRNDAPLSVRRAYRSQELVAIAAEAALVEAARFRGLAGYRYAITFVPAETPSATPRPARAAQDPATTPVRMEERA